MCIHGKERIAFCVQVEGTRGQIFAVLPIALQARFKRVTNQPILIYSHSWPQRQSVHLKWERDTARIHREAAIRGRYVTQSGVLMPGAESSATRVSLMALTEHVHSDRAIPLGQNIFLLMLLPCHRTLWV